MNDDDLGRLLGDAFDRRARSAVPDGAAPPPPHFATAAASGPSRRYRRWAPVLAAAVVVAAVGIGFAASGGEHRSVAGRSPAPTASPLSSYVAPAGAARVRTVVALRQGSTVGVGLPLVVRLSRPITDGRALQAATRVTADGRPLPAAWYFERAADQPGAMTAHLRPQTYWPAHARIQVQVSSAGLSAGTGLAFAGDVHLQFHTAAARVATVDGTTHRLTLVQDGRRVGIFPVSVGAERTPTLRGVKVIMSKGDPICVSAPAYHECGVRFTQRLTYDGEYLVSAPWNVWAVGKSNVSSGSTDLRPTDAQRLYRLLAVGDVLDYRNCHGPMMSATQGYGDWNVAWSTWLTGGLVPTS